MVHNVTTSKAAMPAFVPASPEECPQECGHGRLESLLHGGALKAYGGITVKRGPRGLREWTLNGQQPKIGEAIQVVGEVHVPAQLRQTGIGVVGDVLWGTLFSSSRKRRRTFWT